MDIRLYGCVSILLTNNPLAHNTKKMKGHVTHPKRFIYDTKLKIFLLYYFRSVVTMYTYRYPISYIYMVVCGWGYIVNGENLMYKMVQRFINIFPITKVSLDCYLLSSIITNKKKLNLVFDVCHVNCLYGL